MLLHTKRNIFKILVVCNMRCFIVFVTSVCVLFLPKLKWPKNKNVHSMWWQFSRFEFRLHFVTQFSFKKHRIRMERKKKHDRLACFLKKTGDWIVLVVNLMV